MKKYAAERRRVAISFHEQASRKNTDVPIDDKGIVSFKHALEIFDQLADRPDIAFAYTQDGCYARAHLMCRAMAMLGLAPQKAWAFESDGIYSPCLYVTMPNGKKEEWGWHVAPALLVRMPDCSVQNLVFDPGLFDGPVTAHDWADLIHAHQENLQIVPFGTAPNGYTGHYLPHDPYANPDTHAKETMLKYLKWQDRAPRIVFQTDARRIFCRKKRIRLLKAGKTWVSVRQQPHAVKEKTRALKQ
ncbi:MAG: hypothetical protein KGL10_04715 [Alphaproteobacteria bacterium]|nr:hypothetical protein [Alphaproteobacteria bacterium]MDE2336592.1 hypothetical protein [Alphaproteobacteria bacterium]